MTGTRESMSVFELGSLETVLWNGGIDQFMDSFVIQTIILGRLANHLKLLIELTNIEPRFVFGLRL
jgi:hypothetical protein